MKQLFKILIITIIALLPSCRAAKATHDCVTNSNLIIYYAPEAGNNELLKAAKEYGSEVLYVYKNINGIAVTVPAGKTVNDAIKYYENITGVLSVAKDGKAQPD